MLSSLSSEIYSYNHFDNRGAIIRPLVPNPLYNIKFSYFGCRPKIGLLSLTTGLKPILWSITLKGTEIKELSLDNKKLYPFFVFFSDLSLKSNVEPTQKKFFSRGII